MRRTVRGLVAVLMGTLTTGALAAGALAAVSDGEAEYFDDHPGSMGEITQAVSSWDPGFVMAVNQIRDAAARGEDMGTIAAELQAGLGQIPAELPADGVAASPLPAPVGELAAMESFREELQTDAESVRARIQACRSLIEDADSVVFDTSFGYPGIVGLDLARLPDYAGIVQSIRDHDRAEIIFETETAREQALYVAFRVFTDRQNWPDDLSQMAVELKDISRQSEPTESPAPDPFADS